MIINKVKNTEELKNKNISDRNYGIDLLRLFSMLMVVCLHVQGHGGILYAATGNNYKIAWFIEICAYCAVNCYAIISGYVNYNEKEKPFRYSKYLKFWVQVVFYSFGITLVAFLLKRYDISAKDLILSLFPVTSSSYWYVSAYTGLFFLIPWLNKMIRACTKKEAQIINTVIITVYSLYSTLASPLSDTFKLGGGYSVIWLIIMYILGACIKKCDLTSHFKSRYAFLILALSVLLTYTLKMLFLKTKFEDVLINYTSITIVLIAFSLVVLFSKIKTNNFSNKVISFFSPAAFGVYLIHEQYLVRAKLVGSFVAYAELPAWELPLKILLSAFAIFAVCLIIEKIRLLAFKYLGIDALISFLSKKIDSLFDILSNKLLSN